MLKAGIFLDIENLTRNGGWGMRYEAAMDLVAAQGTSILRANAYMTVDRQRMEEDERYRAKIVSYHQVIRRTGFRLVLKPVKKYFDAEGNQRYAGSADLELAVEALMQSDNLDYVLLGSGDGDFLRLVRALQDRGKRVDVMAFSNCSDELRDEADNFYSGPLIPNLLPPRDDEGTHRGFMHHVDEERGFGFLTILTGFGKTDFRDDVFLHINEFSEDGEPTTNARFAGLRDRRSIIEFDLEEQGDGKVRAVDAVEYVPQRQAPTPRPVEVEV
ncbi:LabA-like NYN domain-containing protein [Stratiformator vulcanicus]|uniref:NYN domain protein n=1 Tax=Stratiformator vulcanicus TaxID=2527980 RepID=A0A517QXP7_9PLAN|nr:NYN domain-containing protein [Stratiformator vulcanicus]QDT36419.1 NYN domain protein [Stratiformator vulcanicus]